MTKDIYRYSDLVELGYGCRTSIYNMIQRGDFPQPRDIFGRPGWYPEDLREVKQAQGKRYTPREPEGIKRHRQELATA